MSWKTGSLMIESCGSQGGDVLKALGYMTAQQAGAASFEEASSFGLEGKALAVVGNWAVLFDPLMFFDLQGDADPPPDGLWPARVEEAILRNAWTVVGFLLSGNSATFGYTHYLQGRRQRSVLFQNDHIVHESGTPSQHELDAFSAHPEDKEQAILKLIGRVATNINALDQISWSIYRVTVCES